MKIRYAAVIMSSNFLSREDILTVQFVEKPGHFLKTEVFQTFYRSTEPIRNSKPSNRPNTHCLEFALTIVVLILCALFKRG